ncbi:hypothetical protein K2173_002048 [Erythroxylum novogranatense]|uniref:Dol-P-Glc:Glc(2)Man(9)GlcNAc(2)-PP-Dol alpha-1,2-glucosyltransferase n=1 Tax=Erythroxylum novogranatense TaxID=1862640 RepID=A0AAV8SQB0_9ROSI|nr:hypothetical protein K2173_002048 [Erythroxylum novogranatense]
MGRIAVVVIMSLWVIPTSIIVNRVVSDPYMDEIFHIPQTQQYCRGKFWSWDPMITTPPGLYYLSLAHVACLFPGMFLTNMVSSVSELCSTAILRSVNCVLAVLCGIVVYEIITHLRPAIANAKATVVALVLALYPLHWFFTFLYYTDVASLTVVLAMYLACLKKRYYLSALLGAFAVLVRQTNIIWMLFVACTGIIDITLACEGESMEVDQSHMLSRRVGNFSSINLVKTSSNMRRRKQNIAMNTDKHHTVHRPASSTTYFPGFIDEIHAICLTSWHMKWKLLFTFSPFIMVLVAFVAFVRWNGSVVLGAKEAHAVSAHFAQVMYFSLVTALLMAPIHFSLHQVLNMTRSFRKHWPLSFCQWLVGLVAGFLSIHFFSIAHPYLLADNRHYTFYLWRKVINANWLMKYLLIPLYVYSWFSIFSIFSMYSFPVHFSSNLCCLLFKYHSVAGKAGKKTIWVLAYFLATAAVLVPAPLIEFRYYTIPFYFLILHSPITYSRTLLLTGAIYLTIDCFTMTMFLFRPFHWSHEPGVQRFIW